MRTRDPTPDRRGVSEVISFTLVFSLIAATVALVYVSGIGGLESTRSSERITNAERAFDVLADNMADIHQKGAPSRATEIKVSNARMEFGESTTVSVQLENVNGTETTNVSSVSLDPIVYSSDSGTDLVYANGAIFRQDRGGTTIDRAPPFLFTDDGGERTAIVPTIETRNDGPESTGSQRTILVRALLAIQEVTLAEDDPETLSGTKLIGDVDPDGDSGNEFNVTVRIETVEERQEVWLDYMNRNIPDSMALNTPPCEAIGDDVVECSLAAENVYSTATRIDIRYN